MQNILIFFYLIIIFFTSCKDNFIPRRDYYIINSTDSNSLTLFEFYDNGYMSSMADYTDSILDGRQIVFREDGSILSKGLFQEGLRNGYWYFYPASKYDTLIPERVEYWKDGKQYGHQYDYYFNGHMKEYVFYNPIGKPIYKRSYSLYGDYEEFGEIKPQAVVKNRNKKFRLNDTFRMNVTGIKPPLTKSKIDISVIGFETEKFSYDIDTFDQSIDFSFPLVKTGKLKIQFLLKIEEDNRIRTDTNSFVFEVIK